MATKTVFVKRLLTF